MTYTCCHDQAHGRLKKLQSLPHHQQHRGTTSASAACRPDQRPHAAVPSGSLAQAGPLPHTNRAARRAASVSCAHHTVPPQATRQSFVLVPAEADQWRHGLVRTRTAPPTRWSGHVAGRTRHGMHCRRTTVRPDVRQSYGQTCGNTDARAAACRSTSPCRRAESSSRAWATLDTPRVRMPCAICAFT